MVIFERFENKKMELKTLEDYKKINNFDLIELKDELEYIKNKIKKESNLKTLPIKEFNDLKKLQRMIEWSISDKEFPSKEEIEKLRDEMYLPEYRKDGYFNSKEFKEIEKEVDEVIASLEIDKRHIEILKQTILKNEYGINWLPYSERFMPGVMVDID